MTKTLWSKLNVFLKTTQQSSSATHSAANFEDFFWSKVDKIFTKTTNVPINYYLLTVPVRDCLHWMMWQQMRSKTLMKQVHMLMLMDRVHTKSTKLRCTHIWMPSATSIGQYLKHTIHNHAKPQPHKDSLWPHCAIVACVSGFAVVTQWDFYNIDRQISVISTYMIVRLKLHLTDLLICCRHLI